MPIKKKSTLQTNLANVFNAGKDNVKKMGASLSQSIPGRNDPLKGVYKSAFRLAKSGARLAVMNPFVSTTLGIAGYLSGSTSRRYAKAPKVGIGRDLSNKKITNDGFDF